jgi:hypothetical protein
LACARFIIAWAQRRTGRGDGRQHEGFDEAKIMSWW